MRFSLLAALSIAFVSVSASADDLCSKTAQAARAIMKGRQDGVPIDVMMAAAEKQKNGIDALTKQLVLSAYEVDRRFSSKSKDRAIIEFGNQAYLICTKAK